MPDFGLGEALENALKAAKSQAVMRPAETKLASAAANVSPPGAAPTVPAAAPSPLTAGPISRRLVARVPASTDVAPAAPPEGSTAVQAPPVNPSVQPGDVPPPQPGDVAGTPAATPAPPDVATASDGAPPAPTSPELPVAPAPQAVDPTAIAPANRVLPTADTSGRIEPPIGDIQQVAQRFVTANIGEFSGKLDMTHMPNTDAMAVPEQLKASILRVADDNAGLIESSRGPTLTDQQLTGLAQDMSINKDAVSQALTREFGGDPATRPKIVLAARMIEQQNLGGLYALGDKVESGAATSEDIARFQQQMQAFVNYRSQIAGVAAQSGRTQRAFGIPVGLPADVMDHIAGVIKQNNPDMQATAEAIRLAGTPKGIADIVHGVFAYRALIKAPFNILQRVFINGILSGPPTWFKIFAGNNFNLALHSFDLFAAGIGRGMVGLAARAGGYPTASEGVTISDAFAHIHGVISGGADALRVAGRVLKTGKSMDELGRANEDFGAQKITSGPKPILPELRDSYFGGIAHMAGTAVDLPGRIIGSVDDFTKTLGYRGYLTMMTLKEIRARISSGTMRPGDAEQTMLQMMQNPSEEMQQASEAWAHRITFQSPWPEDGVGAAFQNVLNKAPALKFIFPFMRTATNIFKQSAVERTPLAIFSARLINQIKAGGFEGDLAKARIATGMAIGSMFAWMAIHDRLTGDAPKDPKARADWELDGRMPYSVRITDPITGKDTWRSYTWFEPISTIAGITADSVQLHAYLSQYEDADSMMPHEDWLSDARSHIMASIIQNVGNKTFMQGAAQFSEMYNDPQRAFDMWFDQVGASAVPFSGATKFLRNMQDPYLRQAFDLHDKILNDLPTMGPLKGSKSLPARLDVFGEPRKTTYGNSILGPMNPLPGSPSVKDDLTDEIQSVMEQTRMVPITMPSKQLKLLGGGQGMQDGSGMRLTPSEYYDYVTMSRKDPIFNGGTQTFRERLEQTIATPVYQAASAPDRIEMLKSVQHSADKAGAAMLYKNNDDFRERMTEWTAQANRMKLNQ